MKFMLQYCAFISFTSSQRHATRPQVGDLVGSVKCVEMPEGSKEEIVGLKIGDLTNDIKVIRGCVKPCTPGEHQNSW